MSRRRYMVRRVGALGVVALLVVVSVELGGLLFQADDTEAGANAGNDLVGTPDSATDTVPAAGTDPATDTGDTGGTDSGGTGPGGTAAGPTTPATVGPPSVPTAADPALVLIAGDSDAGTFGPYLQTLLDQTGVTTTELDYKVSSGLSRPDFFDWPAHFAATIPSVAPDIVVVTFGGNDAQGISDGSGTFLHQQPVGGAPDSDPEWRAEYAERVGATMDYLAADGRTLVWVGIPNDDNPDVTARMQVQDEVVRAEAAKRPEVIFIDTWKRFSGREGNWAEYVIDPRDGQGKDVRADDGFHLNEVGAEILALDIAEAIRQELRDRGATL